MIEKATLTRFENHCNDNGINADKVLSTVGDYIENSGKNSGFDLMMIVQRYYSELEYRSEEEEDTLKHLAVIAESFRLNPVKPK